MKINKGIAKTDLWIDDNILLLKKGMLLDDNDFTILQKLSLEPKVKSGSESKKSDQTPEGVAANILVNLREDYLKFIQFEEELMKNIHSIFSKIRMRQNFSFPDNKKLIEILRINLATNSNFLFFLRTKKRTHKIEEMTFLTCVYAVINAIKLKVDQKWIEEIFNAALVADFYFILYSVTSLKKQFPEGKEFSHKDLSFLKVHCAEGYQEITKISKMNPHYLKAIFTHHEYYNQKGFFHLEAKKIPPFVAFVTVAQEYVYFTTDFLKDFFPSISPTAAIIYMINQTGYYHPKVLQNFILMLSIYPPGEVVEFTSKQIEKGYALSVVAGETIKDTYFAPVVDDSNKVLLENGIFNRNTEPKIKIIGEVSDPGKRKEVINKCYTEWFNVSN